MKRIPNIFHFVFGLKPQTEPFHLSHYLCIASCMEVNQPEKIYFHYKYEPYGELWDRIKDVVHLNRIEEDSFMASFNYENSSIEAYRYAHLSDISRLQILLEYGGVYADIDTIFVQPLSKHLFEYSCVMGEERVDWRMPAAQEAGGSLCNAFIMAEPNSSFIKKWLEVIYEEFDGSWSAHSTFLPFRLSKEHPEWIHVEPERSFFHIDWTKEGVQLLFEKMEEDLSGVYSLHLWSHLWWNKKRTDFTFFHEGRLTSNYVAFANTTYSKLARNYLPKDLKISEQEFYREVRGWRFENIKLRFRL